jgi:hypothetical protein
MHNPNTQDIYTRGTPNKLKSNEREHKIYKSKDIEKGVNRDPLIVLY